MARGFVVFKTMWKYRGKKSSARGATAVEMALIAPAFFLMLIGMTEITLIETAQQILENAAYNTSRLAKTGFTANGQTQTQGISDILDKELQSFGTLFDISKVTMSNTTYTTFEASGAGGGASGFGTAQQIVVYTISYPWKIFTPMIAELVGKDGYITLTSKMVVRNEPY